MNRFCIACCLFLLTLIPGAHALERPDVEFKIFQFPAEMMPHIDGDTTDWDIVGEDYTYRTDQLDGSTGGHPDGIPSEDLDISVRVGWVKGLNRLYFLYEAYDDFWDFAFYNDRSRYRNDILEISLDADISGGDFINNPQIEDRTETLLRFSGVHGQNYHIFTPPVNNNWNMVWGGNPWIDDFPWAHYAYEYDFKPGESGKLILEFWITPFDYAPSAGPEGAAVHQLTESEIIGLSWAVLDFDNGKKDGPGNSNLAHQRGAVSDGSLLCGFRLMPIERNLLPDIEARFSFTVIDMERRLVYFKDESIGDITRWTWRFNDGTVSTERNPIHQYDRPGAQGNVLLEVEGPAGVSRYSKHWEVITK